MSTYEASATKWQPGRYHGERNEDGDSIYFAVESRDEEDCTRLTAYANETKYRELCAMFKVADQILPHREGEE